MDPVICKYINFGRIFLPHCKKGAVNSGVDFTMDDFLEFRTSHVA